MKDKLNNSLIAFRSGRIKDLERRIKILKGSIKGLKRNEEMLEIVLIIRETEDEIQKIYKSIIDLKIS